MDVKNNCLTKLFNFLNEVSSLPFIIGDEKIVGGELWVCPKPSPYSFNMFSTFYK